MGCSPSSKPSTNVTQGTPGSARAQDQAIIEATRAAIRAEVAAESKASKVKEFFIHNNGIGPDGAKAIAAFCAVSGSLTSLNLLNNKIGPEGAKAVADALRVNGSLTKLDVRYNSLGEEAKGALQEVVKGRDGFSLSV